MIIVDGKITVDTSSLEIIQATPEIDDNEEATVVMEEKGGRHLTNSSFLKKRTKVKWTSEAVDLLYEVYYGIF